MTREEAIAYGKKAIALGLNDKTQTFCKLAIKALEQEPCKDAISREAVLEKLHEYFDPLEDGEDICPNDVYHEIKVLPPVNSQSKTAHWIDTGSGQMCSRCGEIQYGYDNFRRFCASCGAKMIEPQKRKDKE